MDNKLRNKCEELIEKTLAAGADACDVILSNGESLSLSAQNGDIDKYKVSGSQVIGVRAIKDLKVGLSYSESLGNDALEITAKSAVENAKNSEVNDYEKIVVKEGEFIFPSEYAEDSSSTEDKIEFCLKLESEVKKRDPRVQAVPYNGLTEVKSGVYYLNSNGVFAHKGDYYQSCYTSALLHEGKKSSMNDYGVVGRKLADLDYEKCINESLEHAREWMNAESLKTGLYDIIFTPNAFHEIFACFSSIFSGKGAMEKTNPYADKINKKVAGEGITIMDIPKYKDAFSKSYFDSEGVSCSDLTLIENGILKSFYHNSATANFFNVKTTGHAARGAKSALGVSGTTKVFSPGSLSLSDIKSGEYFEIHSLQGLYSGANQISGEFSFAASGYLCRDGKRVTPIKGVTASGNFYQLLMNANLVGKDIYGTESKDFFAPLLRFEKASIAGE